MSTTLHCVSQVEQYEGDFFNYKKRAIEYIIDELSIEEVWKSEDGNRIEVCTKDFLQIVEDIDANIIHRSGLIEKPTEENVKAVKRAFKVLYDKADKSLGVVILVWY